MKKMIGAITLCAALSSQVNTGQADEVTKEILDGSRGKVIELEEGDEDGEFDEPRLALESQEEVDSLALSSGVNGYQWWDITQSSVYNLDSRIRPTIMGDNTYFASGGWFNNGQGWYMGLQQDDSGMRRLHAAIWDATAATKSETGDGECSSFGNEGVGKKCWRFYNWPLLLSEGHYKLRIWRLNEDSQGRWWGFWVIKPDGTELHVGNIRAALDADFIGNGGTQDHYNFIENWSHGQYATCNDVPDARYYVYWPRFNNEQKGSIRMDRSETHCVDSVRYSLRTKLEIGL